MRLFGTEPQEEMIGEIMEGMFFFCKRSPLLECSEEREEVVGPGGKNPMGGCYLEWGDTVWMGKVCHVAPGQEGRDSSGKKRLELEGLESMQANTHRTHQGHILLRRQDCPWIELRRVDEWMRSGWGDSKCLQGQQVTGEEEGNLGIERDAGSIVLVTEGAGGGDTTI